MDTGRAVKEGCPVAEGEDPDPDLSLRLWGDRCPPSRPQAEDAEPQAVGTQTPPSRTGAEGAEPRSKAGGGGNSDAWGFGKALWGKP